MIGWCAVQGNYARGELHVSSSQTVHRSAVCTRLKTALPQQVWVASVQGVERFWVPPYDPRTKGVMFKWCQSCEAIPPLGSWRAKARCLGSSWDWIRPGAKTDKLKQFCGGCSVSADCGAYALSVGAEFGVWGGQRMRGSL
jgi:hypothetical protein